MSIFNESISDPDTDSTCEVYVDTGGTHIGISTNVYVGDAWMTIALAKKLGAVLEKAIAAAEAHTERKP